MERRTEDELLARWLAAEDELDWEDLAADDAAAGSDALRAAADARAEAALTALFQSLPLPAPAPGFAERVVRRSRPQLSPVRLPAFLTSPWGRAVALAGMFLAAVVYLLVVFV